MQIYLLISGVLLGVMLILIFIINTYTYFWKSFQIIVMVNMIIALTLSQAKEEQKKYIITLSGQDSVYVKTADKTYKIHSRDIQKVIELDNL